MFQNSSQLSTMMKIALKTFFILAQIMSIHAFSGWHSDISEACPSGQYIYRITGLYSNSHKDRAWTFKCTYSSSVTTTCQKSGWLNEYKGELLYQCPYGVITGLHARYSKKAQDRQFKFTCCYTASNYQYNCNWTPYKNTFQGYLRYKVPSGYYLTGVKSHHDKETGDRTWRFLTCYHV